MAPALSQIADVDERASANRHCRTAPRRRVLHIINGEDYSGAERVQDLLAQRLPEFGFDVGFACVRPNRFPRMCQARVPLWRLRMRGRYDLTPVRQLAGLIRREGYPLVHTHSARAALIGRPAAAIAGVPIVHHMHCQTSTERRRRWLARVNAVVERAVLWGCDAIVAVSPSLYRYLLTRGYGRQRVHLVPNGVPAGALRRQRRMMASPFTVGTVAMFRPRKGLEFLLEAIAQIRSAGMQARLRAVGRFQTDDYRTEIMDLAARLRLTDAIDWTGFCRDVAAQLQLMDVFVLPSVVSEAMPMSVLEAMAAGVPVVGTDVDGTTDLIRDGRDGLIAAAGDSGDLAAALLRIARDEADWRAMRVSAHRRQTTQFSDVSMAAGVAQLYHEVLQARPAAEPRKEKPQCALP